MRQQHYISRKQFPSCFTHQYKNSTQFRLYASLIASQNTKTSKLENIKHVELKKWSDYDTLDVSIASDHLGYYLDIYANDASNRLGYIRILSE